jgi:hypothetical protein
VLGLTGANSAVGLRSMPARYARAAAAIYGLDRFDERHWRRMEEALSRSVERADEPVPSARPSARPPARQVIQSGYMAR